MDILHIITQMLMIFGIVLVGLFAAKRNLWAGDLDRKLSIFIMNISMPALILASVMGKDLAFENSELISLAVVAVVNYIVLIGLAYLIPHLFKVNKARLGISRFMLAFGNVSFIGYPVCDAVFGSKAVFCASVLNIPFNLLVFTIGVSFINGGKAKSAFSPRLIFSPCVVASLIAVVIAVARIQMPTPVGQWFHLLGDLTTPCEPHTRARYVRQSFCLFHDAASPLHSPLSRRWRISSDGDQSLCERRSCCVECHACCHQWYHALPTIW